MSGRTLGTPRGRRKGQQQQPGSVVGARLSPSWQIAFCSLSLSQLRFPQCAISGPGAAFQLQQETIKKSVLFLVQEKRW